MQIAVRYFAVARERLKLEEERLEVAAGATVGAVLDALQAGLKAARDSWHAYVEGNAEQFEQFQTHELGRMAAAGADVREQWFDAPA